MSRDRVGTAAGWLLLAWGTALLVRPREVARAVLGGAPVPPSAVIRVLGARSVLQQLVLLLHPSRPVALTAATVDLLHGTSMGAAALLWPEYRRAALTSGGLAAGQVLLDARTARSQ